MDQSILQEQTFKLPRLFAGEPIEISAETIEAIVPFPDYVLRKLANALRGTGVMGLVGSPGSGKFTALQQASTIPTHYYSLHKYLDTRDMPQPVKDLQPGLDGQRVFALQASQLSEALVCEMVKSKWPSRIVLVGTGKIWGLADVVYHNSEKFAREVAIKIGATQEQLQACGGDLRQLQLAKKMGKYWSTSVDMCGHTYFDTKAILNNKTRAPRFYNKAWLEQNMLASTDDLSVCREFYDSLVFMDVHRYDPVSAWTTKEDVHEEDCHILKLSISKMNKPPTTLQKPVKDETTSACWYYPAFVKNMKRTASHLEGDDADAQLHRLNKNFLATYVYAPHPRSSLTEEEADVPQPPRKRIKNSGEEVPQTSESSQQPPAPTEVKQAATDALPKGTPEYDLFHGWGLYRTKLRGYVDRTQCTAQGAQSYQDAPIDLKAAKWLRVHYSRGIRLDVIATALEEKMSFVLFDVASTDAGVVVFIYKPTQHNIKPLLKVGTHDPERIEVARLGRGQGRSQAKNSQKDLIAQFQQLPGQHITNMYLGRVADVEEYTAKTLFEAVKHMTPEAYTNFVLEAQLKMENGSDVKELERLLCNAHIESRVKELRKLSGRVITNVVYASTVKETGQVQPESVFKNNWKELLVTVHDKSLMTPLMPRKGDKVTLETFLKFPELHQNVTLFIPGDSRKGKTELAKYICLLLAVTYQKDEPRFLMTNTLDSLRNNQSLMLPGVPVLLDDIGGEDNDQQLIYSSISMWKAILQIKDATQNRARNDDLMWASRQPKVMTTNCEHLEDWIVTMFPRAKQNHKEAIKLRTAEVQTIKESLYVHERASNTSQSFLQQEMTTATASEAIASLFG